MKWLLAVTIFLISVSAVSAQEFNAGIVQGLWYDRDEVFVGETTRIYVAIRNNTGADLSGRVEFFDNGTLIERTNVSALDNRIIETWADWTPTFGEHTITASLSRIELSQVGTTTVAAEVVSALAEDTIFVDLDTDGDRLGNQDDPDDDNDGISDNQEKNAGTDPLDPTDPAPETETEETTENEDDETAADVPSNSNVDQNGSDPDGLEQYLTESPADTTLSNLTNSINEAKKRIDAYRNQRNTGSGSNTTTEEPAAEAGSQSEPASATASTTILLNNPLATNEAGFGSITRTTDTKTEKKSDNQSTDSGGWWQKTTALFFTLIDKTYTLLLFILSLVLGHPIFVQLTLLFLILFILIKVAKHLAGRPN